MKNHSLEKKKGRINLKRAITIGEAAIALVVTAGVIAAATPFITKKILNIAEAGAAFGNHGIITVYTKESVTLPKVGDEEAGDWEKIHDDKADSKVTIYQKLTDTEYRHVTGLVPEINTSTGNDNYPFLKSTVYVKLGSATAKYNDDGTITSAKLNGINYTKSEKYIFESNSVNYCKENCTKEILENSDGTKKEIKHCDACKPNLPSGYKIIDGNLTKVCKKDTCKNEYSTIKNDEKDSYFIVKAEKNTKDFNVVLNQEPWIKIYSGNKKLQESKTFDENEPIGIGANKKVTFHAVGGGGAGGTVDNVNQPIIPNPSMKDDDPNLKILKEHLENRLKVLGVKVTSSTVQVINDATLSSEANLTKLNIRDNSNLGKYFKEEDGDPYVLINKANGTILVKFDVRKGYPHIYPDKLLQFTETLGSPEQNPIVYDMPKWMIDGEPFTDLIEIIRKRFRTGGIACGEKGKDNIGPKTGSTNGCEFMAPGTTCTSKRKVSLGDCHAYNYSYDEETARQEVRYTGHYLCYHDCVRSGDPYYKCEPKATKIDACQGWSFEGGCPSDAGCCPSYHCEKSRDTSVTYTGSFYGQEGGDGACGWLAAKIYKDIDPVIWVDKEKPAGRGKDGHVQIAIPDGRKAKMTAQGGKDGKTPEECFGDLNSCGALAQTYPGGSAYCSPKKAPNGTVIFEPSSPDSDHIIKVPGGGEPDDFTGGDCQGKCDESDFDGVDVLGFGLEPGKIYNHIYVWTIPIAYNELSYGKSGEAGKYAYVEYNEQINNSKVKITLGKAGVNNKTKEERNGTATIVEVQACPDLPIINTGDDQNNNANQQQQQTVEYKAILKAEGGKGGDSNKLTDGFDMCFKQFDAYSSNVNEVANINLPANDSKRYEFTCANGKNSTYCCMGDKATNTTRDILSNSIKYSDFDKAGSSVNDSSIVGIGLGRGAMGVGSTTFNEELFGYKALVNASTSTTYKDEKKILIKVNSPGSKPDSYANLLLNPAPLNGTAGGGAVIIVW